MKNAFVFCISVLFTFFSLKGQDKNLDPRLTKAMASLGTTDRTGSSEEEKEEIFFSGNFDELKSKAKEEGKDILLHFGAEWCMPCKQMKKMTYPNALVQKKITEGYLAFEVDVDFFWGMDIAEDYGVLKYPTIIIADADGNVKKKEEGYLGPKELYKLLRAY